MAQGAEDLLSLLEAIVAAPKPVLARVAGHVRAGGMGLVAACDIAVADARATFALTEAKLGLSAAVVSCTVLPRLTSRAASRYLLTGETFSAVTAAQIGLLTQAVDSDDTEALDGAVEGYLGAFRANSPQGLAESKLLATQQIRDVITARRSDLIETSARLFGSEEAREGMAAFLQRRPPRWRVDQG